MGRRRNRQPRRPSQEALDWCIANRQWRRVERIAHAKYQLTLPDAVVSFWRDVLFIQGARA